MATRTEFLRERGWRSIGSAANGVGLTHYWDHPEHQPDTRGAFTTEDAIAHQRRADSEGCDCIVQEPV